MVSLAKIAVAGDNDTFAGLQTSADLNELGALAAQLDSAATGFAALVQHINKLAAAVG